ncbi:MAG: DUF11 domain-containing protein [Ruminococcus sp.]|nr:DUF11 domain-containing protein [Ruminococcus sp.]
MAAFYNQASLTYNGNVTNSNITTGEILEVLSITKSPVTDTYTAGNDVVFLINITNTGTAAINGLTLTDDLGEYTFGEEGATAVPLTYMEGTASLFVNGIKQADPAVVSVSPLTITGISVPAGGNAAVIYAAEPNQFAPLGENASITNTASVSGARATAVTASSTITADTSVSLAISKSLSPAVVSENGTLTYTFIIQNSGAVPVTVSDDVIFADTFDPVLSQLTATFNGAAWTAGTNYTYDETTGVFTSLPGQITVPAAEVSQDTATGIWSIQPGVSTIVITGNI